MWLSTQHFGKDIRTSSYFLTRRAADVVSEACFTGDDRRSPWWASRDGPQHDHIRSDTVMICMIFNSYTSLVVFFAIPVLFCFVFQHKTLYTIRVLANCAWKPLKLALSILFSIWGFSSLLTFYNVNYSAWYIYKPLIGSSVATCRLECSEISLSIIEKYLEKSPSKGRT